MAPAGQRGFTLLEVVVALAIVALALMAGVQATTALTRNALRQSDIVLAQLCAENELIKARLSRQMPNVGDSTADCVQAGRLLQVQTNVLPTPNPGFRRIDARVVDGENAILRISTVIGRY
ncbi:type II secretion system protein GspI [Verminephrobacter aporrectodeae subsp. tuberculatae]|uniref:Type II secretion system protein I n=2 Tax=Verminephrobacter TaxID=364316 RepID=A0ABT3KSS6_9BURK|nr:type II secretion system minor pseudopilin GspI [Verminephrobacter aporrectodeae]MCW5222343.1 type II secretion system protein GspI [Verminephrobacter aporrectodeae subsp. tuberculatae]MCW5257444.1 type II secretion system protein GspI [Verminephrobacter aporrectodeae subsp. tuberculatae]MCW5287807.1 type II secretion system protein GspI [Verminephrobacter aporrectodeae subsp. tuberculatae]MCW5321374.1 type II secretion system protein GspI [Verminephrobacter aporrectodeae subsp. tuberculatae